MKALLVIDMQNDFMPWGALPVPEADKLIPYINQLIDRSSHTIASQDWHPKGHVSFASTHNKPPFSTIDIDGAEQILWPDHCIQNTEGADFVKGLAKEKFDTIIKKGCDLRVDSYSAFYDNAKKHDSGLHGYCKKKGITSFRVVGVALDYCVLFSVLDALSLEYAVEVDLYGCRGVESKKGDCALALEKMRKAGALILDGIDSMS